MPKAMEDEMMCAEALEYSAMWEAWWTVEKGIVIEVVPVVVGDGLNR